MGAAVWARRGGGGGLGGGSGFALWAETAVPVWGGGGGGLGSVYAASGPPAPVLVSVLDGGVVVVTALVCGVACAVLMRAGPRQSSAVQH